MCWSGEISSLVVVFFRLLSQSLEGVLGARIENVIRSRAESLGISYEEMEAQYLSQVSLRRMVEPEDVAGMALFLSSPAGANISGQAISVCGNVETI